MNDSNKQQGAGTPGQAQKQPQQGGTGHSQPNAPDKKSASGSQEQQDQEKRRQQQQGEKSDRP